MGSFHHDNVLVTARCPLVAVLFTLCGLTCGTILAADPTLESLQRELRQIFPASPTKNPSVSPGVATSADPYAIIEKDYLWAGTANPAERPRSTSLRQIRSYTPPIRQAHAACVKIITPYWHGAGIMISPTGDVLTSYHLVAEAPAITVQTLDGRLHPVTGIAAFSATHDLALLRVNGSSFVCLPVDREAPPATGQPLSIVGHPGGVSWKLSSGRMLRQAADDGSDVIHFDSDIGRGNSGGPVIDEAGRLCALTACAATLADGSTVKVGVSAKAMREFLASPRHDVSLPELAVLERNRRAAEFLQEVYLLMDEWMGAWLASMGEVSVSLSGRDATLPAAGRRVTFVNLQHAAGSSIQFLLLRSLMARSSELSDLNSQLKASMTDFSGVLGHLLACSAALSQAAGRSSSEARLALAQARQERALASRHFGAALVRLDTFSRGMALRETKPRRTGRLDSLVSKYVPGGCRVEINSPEG
jgi:hypothetical protein